MSAPDDSESASQGLAALLDAWRRRDAALGADPDPYPRLAEDLRRWGEPLLTYDVAREGLEHFPQDRRLRQLAALALADSGVPDRALGMLEQLRQEGTSTRRRSAYSPAATRTCGRGASMRRGGRSTWPGPSRRIPMHTRRPAGTAAPFAVGLFTALIAWTPDTDLAFDLLRTRYKRFMEIRGLSTELTARLLEGVQPEPRFGMVIRRAQNTMARLEALARLMELQFGVEGGRAFELGVRAGYLAETFGYVSQTPDETRVQALANLFGAIGEQTARIRQLSTCLPDLVGATLLEVAETAKAKDQVKEAFEGFAGLSQRLVDVRFRAAV